MVVAPGLTRLALAAPVLALGLALAGCAELTRWDPDGPGRAEPPAAARVVPGVHVVQRGDTLFQIAFTYRLDWRDVAAWNRIGDGSRIYPGQEIRLYPPGGSPQQVGTTPSRPAPSAHPAPGARPPAPAPPRGVAGPPPQWRWPASGPVVWRFGESRRNPTGIGIGGADGTEIRAAADGEVVYSGSGLIGYGQLIILKHNDSFLSAYGYNRSLRVGEGERVKAGQVIALMGRGPADRPLLHFEIRVDGKPADPARYLPAR